VQSALAGTLSAAGLIAGAPVLSQTPSAARAVLDELVIDLASAPESIDPLFAYSPIDWSIVHSIYDAPVGFAADGSIQPLAAESFELVDDTTLVIVLRSGLQFHDGGPVTAEAIVRSVEAMQASGSQASSLFTGITGVEIGPDDLTATLSLDAAAPWLPAQIATWLVLLPEGFSSDAALQAPVGSGPYRFESQEAGSTITLVRNADYPNDSLKGHAVAERVTYRFVPELATRLSDLASGAAQIVTAVPFDQADTIADADASHVEEPIVASAWIRIHAVDVESVTQALVSPESHRLATLFPDERALGFDPDLAPYEFDSDKARSLLKEAGHGDGLEVRLEITTGSRVDVAEAIAAQLNEAGFSASIVTSEIATFNGSWKEASAPALRLVTWGPLYDPHSLLSLVYAGDGFLSRYSNAEVDALIADAGQETDPTARQGLYQQLGELMHEDAPAIFLWNLVSGYGVSEDAAAWTPRGDEYVLPMSGNA
jgi:peptide/nickel transport system substrate-binding protein